MTLFSSPAVLGDWFVCSLSQQSLLRTGTTITWMHNPTVVLSLPLCNRCRWKAACTVPRHWVPRTSWRTSGSAKLLPPDEQRTLEGAWSLTRGPQDGAIADGGCNLLLFFFFLLKSYILKKKKTNTSFMVHEDQFQICFCGWNIPD